MIMGNLEIQNRAVRALLGAFIGDALALGPLGTTTSMSLDEIMEIGSVIIQIPNRIALMPA